MLMVWQTSLFLAPPPQHLWTVAIAVLDSPYIATDAESTKMCDSDSQGARNGQEESLKCSLLMTSLETVLVLLLFI